MIFRFNGKNHFIFSHYFNGHFSSWHNTSCTSIKTRTSPNSKPPRKDREHLSKISDHLDKVLSSDACQINPGPVQDPDDSCATRLGNIADRLGNVGERLNDIQANEPPGPPNDAALIKNLDTIINLANHIADIAKQAPGPPNDAAVQAALANIVSEANAISSTANSILQQAPGPPTEPPQ